MSSSSSSSSPPIMIGCTVIDACTVTGPVQSLQANKATDVHRSVIAVCLNAHFDGPQAWTCLLADARAEDPVSRGRIAGCTGTYQDASQG
jgi:glycerol uptake facilitator-like aquaporin